MKLGIGTFGVVLLWGLVATLFVAWCLSLLLALGTLGQRQSENDAQHFQVQLSQLEQKHRLWLRTQYYLLTSLIESAGAEHDFHPLMLEYYRRNPTIWAVNLVQFDAGGRPVSRANKPGCRQPRELRPGELGDFLEPALVACRVGDKALLEIAGPARVDDQPALLLVSTDYFGFLDEFSAATGRKLQRIFTDEGELRFDEIDIGGDAAARIRLVLGNRDGIDAEVYLARRPPDFGEVFGSHLLWLVFLLTLASLVATVFFYRGLVAPLERLAEAMREFAGAERDADGGQLRPGLTKLFDYLGELKQTVKRDPVTGLNNRIIFEDRLAQAIREGKRSGRHYALLLADLRGVDDVAHYQGQYIADTLLRLAAEYLRLNLRESDNLARFERNLFALLIEFDDRDQLGTLVEKIYLTLARPYQVHGREFELRAQVGVAIYPDHALAAEELYQHASEALAIAERGDWPIRYFREADETDTSGFSLIQALRRALRHDELKLVYQPVIDLDSFETVYFEALLRWKDPARQEFSIERTIRLAERNHLIKPLTNWIIDAACRFIRDCGIYNLRVGVNLSMIDLHDRQLPARIEASLKKYQVKPSQIVVEITEGQIMQDPDEVIEVLAHLGVMGLSLSIDDFGTGQATLTYLKELPVEKLKIDQSFVRDIDTNPDDRLIVKATIELAHTLDLKVVAEGAETLAVCELLVEMQCDYAQGFYLCRPLESDGVADWYASSVRPDLFRKGR